MSTGAQWPGGSPRSLLWRAALVYIAFVIYGSLVPLDFHALPWDEALARFRQIPFLELGIGSRADWVANLILYMPVGYLLMAAWIGRSRQPAVWAGGIFLAGLAVAGLALAVEFAQLFFPPRTVSLNDLYAEWAGGALGMLLWPLTGRTLLDIWARFALGGTRSVRAGLVLYALTYLFLSLFPYDFLLSAGEWHDHLATPGKAGWLFAGGCGLGCWAKLVAEMIATIPFGLLLVNRSRRVSMLAAAGIGVVLGLTIEILQLSIASGISQGASVLSRTVGVMLGAWLPALFKHWDSRRMRPWLRTGLVLAAFPYAGGLAWLNHWFAGPWSGTGAALDRLAGVRFIPFYYHYYTAEAVALVSLVYQFGLYLPLGVGVWLWHLGSRSRPYGTGLSALLGLVAATTIETGRLFVPGQHPDPTNVLIAATAAGCGHAILAWLFPATPPASRPIVEPHAAEMPASPPAAEKTSTSPPARLTAFALLAAAVLSLFGYPPGWLPWFVPLLLILAAVCWRWPGSWLIVVPAALPLLDFSYLSGRLFWSGFDTLLLLTLAAAYSRERVNPAMVWPGRLPLVIYTASALISLASGLLPLAPLDLNAFTHYTSPYNALRAVKGLAFALAFLPLLKAEWHRDERQFTARLALGMTLGLASELLYILWERATFSGLWNFDTDYRITGSFSGMHIGGASIEAYLVLAAPFVWLWAWPRRRAWPMLVAGGLYGLSAYGVMVTFSRGGQGAFVVATLLLLAGFTRLKVKTRRQGVSGILILLVSVVAAGLVAWPIISGKFSESRLALVRTDIGMRTAHWRNVLEILSQAGNPYVGAGAGTYPAAFYWYSSTRTRPATYAFAREGSNVFLRLGSGEPLYLEQSVPVLPNREYRIQMDVRSRDKTAELQVPLCEKARLYSYTCFWSTIKYASNDGEWVRREVRVNTTHFGPPGSLLQRPVELSMFYEGKEGVIEVDNVALVDEAGHNLIQNGDFSQGMQHWFFSVDDYWPWHIENNFIHVFFEQGWLGLVAFIALLAAAMKTLRRRMASSPLELTLFISITAFLLVGLVNSPIDEPHLAFLFFWLLLIALVSGGKVLTRRRKPGRPRPLHARDEGMVQS